MNSTLKAAGTLSVSDSEIDVRPCSRHARAKADIHPVDGRYAKYVLAVLVLVFVCNAVDRSIFVILAEDIKADLGLSDAQLGFLGGTAFSVFYAIFGMVLSRLADVWSRKKLMAIGLSFWSVMTALSGAAKAFLPLTLCRFGVAIGESSATPAAFSILYDYFSPKVRTTVLSIYSAGGIVGGALGLFLGGVILDYWKTAYPTSELAPLGLEGWQAAFVIVGLPGVFMALWLSTLHEPARGRGDGVFCPPHPTPFRETAMVLLGMLPFLNLWSLARQGGRRAVIVNLAAGFVIAALAGSLIHITDSVAQWLAMGAGVFAAVSWLQSLALRDPVIFGLIFQCRTYLFLLAGTTASGVGMSIISFWAIPYLQRHFQVSASDVGAVAGLANGLSGFIGLLLGGLIADKLRRHNRRGKFYVMLCSIAIMVISIFLFVGTERLFLAYAGVVLGTLATGVISGPAVSTINDLMLPRGRATVTALFFMIGYLFSGSLAPYAIGHMSDVMSTAGISGSESLRRAMLWCFVPALFIHVVCTLQAMRFIEADEINLLERARKLGERL